MTKLEENAVRAGNQSTRRSEGSRWLILHWRERQCCTLSELLKKRGTGYFSNNLTSNRISGNALMKTNLASETAKAFCLRRFQPKTHTLRSLQEAGISKGRRWNDTRKEQETDDCVHLSECKVRAVSTRHSHGELNLTSASSEHQKSFATKMILAGAYNDKVVIKCKLYKKSKHNEIEGELD
ncbi:hypothetical protein EGR_05434 [Echinococcus granulosus]|uniref:Uncharacterized protein n=1 Tax=Echinococcus granulosus TaxID=6210 RepID=W6UN94_ECHGR|nr:hypothetical protein EGR_05434 [Echinococcus granulosus]EUB59672.1 hypothetical protein EGR_05434 [Echinococcus granulosus]